MNDTAAEAVASAGQAATGVDRIDARAVNKPSERSLYKSREKVYPKLAHGTFRRLKWLVLIASLSIYYITPWIRWDRGPDISNQAVLADFPGRRFFFFFIEIWPQEVYFLTGLLILASLGLFLVTSLAGRVWCGYACPQTVWTDLFIAVERFVEGDRNARIKLDRASFGLAKLTRKTIKHLIWVAIALATGGAWVFYFADAPTLARQLVTLDAPLVAYLFIGIFSATTYALGGLAREQVCTYMCPWPRIQAALQDEYSLVVTYHPERGDPRGPHKKNEPWEGRGHCVDCNQCVAVCPAGIDIRDGQQLECISCALCIDACNGVMKKLSLPPNLIFYDTLQGVSTKSEERVGYRFIRPRTVIYSVLILVVGLVMLGTLVTRSDLDLTVQRDRTPLFVALSDGSIRNGYTLKILNKSHDTRSFSLNVQDLPGATIQVIGSTETGDGEERALTVPADKLRSFRVYVSAPRASVPSGRTSMTFAIKDQAEGTVDFYKGSFRGPDSE
jgi:cytochrome c oxidase accessory protein FixG